MNYICNCPKSDFSKHNYTYWEDRDTTSDEIEIIDFLENSYKLESKKILHIGIGNSFFAKKLMSQLSFSSDFQKQLYFSLSLS